MKKALWIFTIVIAVAACNSSKKTSSQTSSSNAMTNQKANLLDGSWEVNYIMPQQRSFADLFPKKKPTINFNSVDGRMSGLTGCNQFNGSYTTNGNSISIPSELALTRKMCPDMAGEQAFLETLKKVNKFSVTDQGKTLNMMMGDMAILRASRQ